MRAIVSLCAVLGQFGKPGAGTCFINGPNTRGIDLNTLMAPQLGTQGTISQMDLATCLEDSALSQALVCWNNNILASNPDQTRLRAALEHEDLFHVCLEMFETDTTDFADYVLPAASFLEFDDLVVPYFRSTISTQVKVKEPEGEALPNQEIFRRLSRAMGFTEPELCETDAELIATALRQAGVSETFAELAAVGTIEPHAEPYVQFAHLKFPTPSGKIELASARAEQEGQPCLPDAHADAPNAASQLRILSPAGPLRMNSEYGNAPVLRQRARPERR